MSDLIDRQAVLLQIDNAISEENRGWVLRELKTLRMCIEYLPPAQPEQKWIPCSVRLPEIIENHVSDTVICYCSNGAYAFSQLQENIFGQCSFECERDDDYYEAVGDVIAWMPLPKPYGGDGDV